MDAVHVLFTKNVKREDLRSALAERWPVTTSPFYDLVIATDERRVYIDVESSPGSPDLTLVSLTHSCGLALVKQILLVIADDADALVDNEYGELMSGDAYVARLREDPDWDWRQ